MSTDTSWPPGVPCWADLMIPDPDAVKPFYTAVLGWAFDEQQEPFGGYVMATKGGAPVAGLGPMNAASRAGWTLYFASGNADATAAKVTAGSGVLFGEPVDVGDLGRMFVATDPTGAVFGVWQARSFAGAGRSNEPGALTWEDLRSTDPDAARTFYAGVFDFTYDTVTGAPADYTTFATAADPRPRGGMGGASGSDGAQSHWLVYFGVADTAAAVEAATANGGAAPVPAFDTPWGAMAGLTDPAGAAFYVVQMPES